MGQGSALALAQTDPDPFTSAKVYFAQFARERSLNTRDSTRLELPLTHVRPWLGASYLNTRDRPGFEIDARARRTETAFSGGFDVIVSRKTTLRAGLRQTRIDFPSDVTFQGTYLRHVFNRKTLVGSASLRYALTPLTTLVMEAEVEHGRVYATPTADRRVRHGAPLGWLQTLPTETRESRGRLAAAGRASLATPTRPR